MTGALAYLFHQQLSEVVLFLSSLMVGKKIKKSFSSLLNLYRIFSLWDFTDMCWKRRTKDSEFTNVSLIPVLKSNVTVTKLVLNLQYADVLIILKKLPPGG